MANPQPGLGSGAPAPASSSGPYRRVPRLVKRRHSASSSRSQPPPPPATPWNPFGSVGGGGSAQAATKDAPVGNSGLGSGHADRGADFEIGKGPSAEFVFGAGAASARQSPESGAAPFEFGSARSSLPRFEKGSSSSSSSSSSKLSYKMRRLKLRSSGKGGDVGKGADQKVELGKDVSFAFGVDVSSLVRNREASTLPERMTQLNIGNGAPLTGMGSEHASHPLAKFVFGSNMTSSPVDSTTDADSGVNATASSTVHGADSNVLPEKMERLNVGRRATLDGTAGRNASCMPKAFVFGSNKTTDSVSGKSTRSTLDNSSDFIPVASANASSSANDTKGSVLPEKNSESDIGYGVPLQRMGSDSTSHPPEVFVFGSNGTTSFISGQSANRIVDNGNDFVSGTDANASTSNHGPESNTLPEKMTKLNIGCGVLSHSTESGNANRPPEVFVFGSNGATSSVSGQTTNMPFTSSRTRAFSELLNNRKCSTKQFSFQGKAEANSRYGSVPQPIIQEPCDSVRPLNSSYSFHTFQNGVSDFSFRTVNAEGVPSDFGTVKQDPSGMFTESLFGYENIKTAYRDKKEECKSTKRKKRLTRLKQRSPFHQSVSQEACTNEPELELPGDYSPMDCSPYPASAEQMTGEASTTSDESTNMHGGSASNQNSSCVEEVLVSATEHLVIDGDLPTFKQECGVHNADAIKSNVSSSSRLDEKTNLSNASQPCSGNVNVGINDEIGTTTNEAMADYYGYNIDGQTSEDNTNKQAPEFGEPFTFASNSANFSGLNFTFSASLPPQSTSSAQKRNSRRKFKMKDGQVSQPSVTQASLQPNASQDTKGMQFSHEPRKLKNSSKEQATSDASVSAALETCDTWRTSGNQAYAKGHFATAEEHYTRGISSISHHGTAGLCSRSLMLCYSNRAATRMSLGRMREALQDCIIAASIDPSFLKAKVRAANCYLALGDFEDASRSYAECLQSNNSASSDPKIFSEASDGLERSNRVADWISQSKELLVKRTCNAASSALELISDALRISSHADNLMEMKAEALLMLQRYEAVIQLCQETMDLAERNSALRSASEELKNGSTSEKTKCPSRLWRSYLICKSYFCLGKLEEALGLLKKDEQAMPAEKRCKSSSHWSTYPECFSSLSATINQLLRLKAAGNEAFQAGRYSDAVEQYSAALAYNCESRPFSAVCFCNRAAAYQALGQVTDAIADCSLAIVLNANYPKAISRRATLYEMIRDYGQAANDLQKLISLLEKQDDQSRAARAAANKHSDLKQAHVRLSSMEDEAKKEIPLNLYLILGVDPSCSAADVKKAYRKAALRHHPDKAAQLLVRNENADDGFWRDVAKEVHADADHLFKTIGEAYNMLSDPGKRQDYDTHEELRNTKKRSFKGRTMYRSPEQHYSKQYGGFTPRQSWSNKSASHSRWAGYSDDFW